MPDRIPFLRLQQQQIAAQRFQTPQDLLAWMGALQAQDYPMMKWAAGLRLPGATEQGIDAALAAGTVIRTHALRPTWHLLPAADIYWILELTAPHILASMRSRHRELELSGELLSRSRAVLEAELRGGQHKTREDLKPVLEAAGIRNDDNRLAHVLLCAELEGLICSGPGSGSRQTYALLPEVVPQARRLPREEALATLALRYFRSHGPATLADFGWWSGLPAGDARRALASVRHLLREEQAGGSAYWMDAEAQPADPEPGRLYLLPAFDEYLVSYKDRQAVLPQAQHQRAVHVNGVFRPIIVHEGQVIGTWKRSAKGSRVLLEAEWFGVPDPELEAAFVREGEAFRRFRGAE
ncbi:MAG: winged helix DNA-binding domain-containing protein [Bacteroidia bacterium]|nr:winged helix DNA-binding domain-containing protein [Bacteroidia bacterium]